eukprot:CAMPEP_0181326782 /NCGR_PEP_ID=MMETSP1101-20121128/21708_1 /TAXON_ID=46948 /ORGANISM="Rhodomonas abbreviata, Strain Caron Lab Isolate" /LENGTH=78 /DNA_ID=CAMNT_0023435311 /DNA_START=13 /DNA_END=249 /DNA_ORIENTATION=+
MSGKGGPDLKKFMDKRVTLKLNANRQVSGVLRGFDQFMNVVLDHTVEHVSAHEKNEIGMVVVRGNSIAMVECVDKAFG